VARLIERKGQHHLIQAVKQLTDEGFEVTLDLVGDGDARPAYEAQVGELRLERHVSFLGYVPREEIARHYASAHVFVLPSYNEGMSVATLEAMAAGLPVVVTRTGGTAELVQEGSNGFAFDWADVDTLVERLRCLATERDRARLMGEASSIHAASFTWKAASDRYLEMYTTLAQSNGQREAT
jgi:glycosyltransferase involved in cell wall biosynthesis